MQKLAHPTSQIKVVWILVITHIANKDLCSCFKRVANFPRLNRQKSFYMASLLVPVQPHIAV